MLDVIGIERAVIVQPSVYCSDNRATLDAVARAGEAFRAVVVLDDTATRRDLEKMHDQGARGTRVNALFSGDAEREDLFRLGGLLADQGWHMQMLIDVSRFADLEGFVRALPVPVVLDHMGHMPCAEGPNAPGFQALLRLLGEGRVWTKLSGSYRITAEAEPPYGDVTPFARAQHLGHGSVQRNGSERHGGTDCLRRDQIPHGRASGRREPAAAGRGPL